MALRADYHVHSNYSDGRPMPAMIAAAAEADLEAIGFTDHCNVSSREPLRAAKREFGFNLDLTYRRRRRAIDSFRERTDLAIYDGVELDYDPRDEAEVAAFLEEAAFDYAIGSVHALDSTVIFDQEHFAARSDDELREMVETYYDRVTALVESELFDVVGHVDAIERTPALRGYSTPEQYARVADALADSRTVPEINAGAIGDYGAFHPSSEFLEVLRDRGVRFVPGTDSHRPDEVRERAPRLADRFRELGIEPTTPLP